MATPAGEPDEKGFDLLLRCLAVPEPTVLPPLAEAFHRAADAGGAPFEVIAGAPFRRYGARVTFRPTGEAGSLAAAFGLDSHPWGDPTWVGIRVRPDGSVQAKAYHRLEGSLGRLDGRFVLPPGLPAGLRPVMAALHEGSRELYLRLGPAAPSWTSFAAAVGAALEMNGIEKDLPFSPPPRPAEDGFCLSLRWQDGALTTLSLFADQRSLPGDGEIRRAWPEGMDETDRNAYEAALAAVRGLGRLPPSHAWHGMLAWTLELSPEGSGFWHRAASLRVPPL
ncbi:MAG TPA: hypothetical protein VEL74_08705 [Thermoanaerobaculia bacterium]|nr:hypothetical protein [Thermoanaerobaculia bacterium]